jgi:hypothetical protein
MKDKNSILVVAKWSAIVATIVGFGLAIITYLACNLGWL